MKLTLSVRTPVSRAGAPARGAVAAGPSAWAGASSASRAGDPAAAAPGAGPGAALGAIRAHAATRTAAPSAARGERDMIVARVRAYSPWREADRRGRGGRDRPHGRPHPRVHATVLLVPPVSPIFRQERTTVARAGTTLRTRPRAVRASRACARRGAP